MRAFVMTVSLLVLGVVTVNALEAWNADRHDRQFRTLAADLRPGQAVIVTRELDDRRLQRVRLQVIPRPTVVAFGSSRIMPLGGAALGLGPGQFYNAGVSAASVEDYIAFWQLLRQGPDGRGLSRQQGAAAFNGLATGLHHGMAEVVVPLQVGCLGHDGIVKHAQIHAVYEHDFIGSVE